MNNVEIIGMKPVYVDQIETKRLNDVPSVGAAGAIDAPTTELSDETEAGLLRFARFLTQTPKDKATKRKLDPRRARAFQAYESILNFADREKRGGLLNQLI